MLPSDHSAPEFPSTVDFGREICCELSAAESREWLVTNGIGGYAFGTIAGLQTRCYHGLLVAALQPPLGRTLLVAKLDETARCGSEEFALSANRWADGTVSPQGYLQHRAVPFGRDDSRLDLCTGGRAARKTNLHAIRIEHDVCPVPARARNFPRGIVDQSGGRLRR